MKIIFVFFLLINAAYFYFQSEWYQGPSPSVIIKQPAMSSGAEKLVLLRERGLGSPSVIPAEPTQTTPGLQILAEPEPEPEAEPETEAEVVQQEEQIAAPENGPVASIVEKLPPNPIKSTEVACFTLGPFGQAAQASRAAEAISALGVDVNRRQESHRTPKGYWVYLPPSASYKSALRKVKEMQKKGLKDLFIMGKGSHKNAISLGLFKNRNAAKERLQQVKAMDLKAVMETQYRVIKEVWLDISVPGDQTTTVASVTEIAETIPKASLTQRKCD